MVKTHKINILFFDLEKFITPTIIPPVDKDVIEVVDVSGTSTFHRLTKYYQNIEITGGDTQIDEFIGELDTLPPLPPSPPSPPLSHLSSFDESFLDSFKNKGCKMYTLNKLMSQETAQAAADAAGGVKVPPVFPVPLKDRFKTFKYNNNTIIFIGKQNTDLSSYTITNSTNFLNNDEFKINPMTGGAKKKGSKKMSSDAKKKVSKKSSKKMSCGAKKKVSKKMTGGAKKKSVKKPTCDNK